MTKRRPPLSIDAALARIAGQLPGGWADLAAAAARKERTARNWGDPETPESIPMDCAIRLDLAYQQAGGDGAPIFEAYACQLEASGIERFADRLALARAAAVSVRESGEAHAAAIAATQPGSDEADRLHALRENEEAIAAQRRIASLLERPLDAEPRPP